MGGRPFLFSEASKEDLEMNEKLFVGNLSYATAEEDLRRLFAQAGTVTACDMIRDRATDRPKGFAFVTMSTQAEAENATWMFNAYSLSDRQLTVNVAKPREPRSDFGGSRRSGNDRR
jgi:RNA recognition motif-containing protein